MIVTREDFPQVLNQLQDADWVALDCETTGLRPYHGDRLFSLGLYSGGNAYYMSWNQYEDVTEGHPYLLGKMHLERLREFFAVPRIYMGHNLKFDLAMLAQEGIKVAGTWHDSMVVARVLDSTLWQGDFSLDACGKRLGYEKLDTVKNYLLANKLFTVEKVDGKKTQKKNLHYALAPLDLIAPYCEKDTEITYRLGERQLRDLQEVSAAMPAGMPNIRQVYANECELLQTVFAMEQLGVLIDRDYCKRAIVHAEEMQERALEVFQDKVGEPFKDSNVVYQRAFADEKDRWVWGDVTPTGKRNPSFDSDVLETFQSPAAAAVVAWRKAKSDANYFHGFLYEADGDGVIHASFNQHVAATGRFSSSNPNLQNLTKDEDAALAQEFVVRRAIVPRPGMVFHMLDFDQMEYRLMLDYAARFAVDNDGVLTLIQKVLGGLDVHQATADVAGVSRRDAKTVNFATLYGSGIASLAARLARSEVETRAIRDSIFRAAPEISTFIRRVSGTAEKRGFIVNWFGRRCSFPDASFAYRAPNYLIQGGSADVVKLAMNRIHRYLQPFKTRMVLTIHDEVVFEGPPKEAAIVIPEVQRIMETAYPAKHVPLACSVDHSYKSLADKKEGIASCVNN